MTEEPKPLTDEDLHTIDELLANLARLWRSRYPDLVPEMAEFAHFARDLLAEVRRLRATASAASLERTSLREELERLRARVGELERRTSR